MLVIALFYTTEIAWNYLVIAAGVFTVLIIVNRLRVRHIPIYYLLGIFLWLAFLKSGLHATISGVLLALTIPAQTHIKREDFLCGTFHWFSVFETASKEHDCVLANEDQQEAIHALEHLCDKVNSPALKVEHSLHPWVTYLIMPIFALANAGVHFEGNVVDSLFSATSIGIMMGLVLGKPVGITLFSWFAVKSGLANMPEGVSWPQLAGGACPSSDLHLVHE